MVQLPPSLLSSEEQKSFVLRTWNKCTNLHELPSANLQNLLSSMQQRLRTRSVYWNKYSNLQHRSILTFCKKTKWSSKSHVYYANSLAERQTLLRSGDIEINPGPTADPKTQNTNSNSNSDYLLDFAKSINHGNKSLKIAHINIRSLRNKVDEVKLLLHICRLDILAITESHLDRNFSNRQLMIENYKIVRRDRSAGTAGGGCLVYIADHICSSHLKSLETPEIEGIWLKITTNSTSFILGNIY